MSTPFDRLVRLAPPPDAPVHRGTVDSFTRIESELETVLPDDFKQIILTYGSGTWLDFYWLVNPFDPHFSEEWGPSEYGSLGYLQTSRQRFPETEVYSVWPSPGGVLPWGGNENGGLLCWITSGEPNQWRTVHRADRTPDFEEIDGTVAEVLAAAIAKENISLSEVPYSIRPDPAPFSQ